ncbi:MAG: HAMP domain-containing sensor histidine kinase [Bacteroidota bacterium]
MNKHTLNIIVSLMALVLTILVGIQLFWVLNAIELRKERFENKVNDLITGVVNKLEKAELATQMGGSPFGFMGAVVIDVDSAEAQKMLSKTNDIMGTVMSQKDVENNNNEKSIPSNTTKTEKNSANEHNIYKDSANNSTTVNINSKKNKLKGNLIKQDFKSIKDVKSYLEKVRMVKDVFNEMTKKVKKTSIKDRINVKQLDSLINDEMSKNELNTPFKFAITDYADEHIVMSDDTLYSEEILKSNYQYKLFPHDILSSPYYLKIYFPDKNGYLIYKMWGILILSIMVIAIVVAIFYFTVHTLIKQKKLTNMKNDFINNMTHEIKTPLSTISLACEALNDPDIEKSDDLLMSYIKIIEGENKRLVLLTDNVLQTAIIDKGELFLKPVEVDVNEVIDYTIQKIKLQIEKRNGVLEVHKDATNPIIKADRVHFTNVVSNLLDNAVKYSADHPYVKLTTKSDFDGLYVIVEDNGIGMSKSSQKKIFEKFYRVPTGNLHDVKGYGLGLSYVKSIIEKHHGQISVVSELGKGSKFIIFIPMI